jgi:enoyl-CoA hydratase/carnithine racemase
MPYVNVRVEGGVAAVVLCRGKVNALDEATWRNLQEIRIH